MTEWQIILAVGGIIFITHCLEGITGFGCTALALPFVVLLMDLSVAKPILVVLAWILAGYIVLRSYRHFEWKPFQFILLHVAIGFPVGLLLYEMLPRKALMALLAAFMVVVGIRGFWVTYRERAAARNTPAAPGGIPQRHPLMRGILALGGLIHGAFGTGGPFVVIYASKALKDKSVFRVTLCMLWLILNSILMIQWTIKGGVWTPQIGVTLATTMPFLIGGMLLGDFLHHRTNERLFRYLVYAVLFVSGLIVIQSEFCKGH